MRIIGIVAKENPTELLAKSPFTGDSIIDDTWDSEKYQEVIYDDADENPYTEKLLVVANGGFLAQELRKFTGSDPEFLAITSSLDIVTSLMITSKFAPLIATAENFSWRTRLPYSKFIEIKSFVLFDESIPASLLGVIERFFVEFENKVRFID